MEWQWCHSSYQQHTVPLLDTPSIVGSGLWATATISKYTHTQCYYTPQWVWMRRVVGVLAEWSAATTDRTAICSTSSRNLITTGNKHTLYLEHQKWRPYKVRGVFSWWETLALFVDCYQSSRCTLWLMLLVLAPGSVIVSWVATMSTTQLSVRRTLQSEDVRMAYLCFWYNTQGCNNVHYYTLLQDSSLMFTDSTAASFIQHH